MPHLQELWKQHKDNPDILTLAVVTAQEKEDNPEIADDAITLQRLKDFGWTMPVARDDDEKTIPLLRRPYPFSSKQSTGTPVCIIIDASGYVVAHEMNYQDSATETLNKVLATSLAALGHGELRDVHKVFDDVVAMMAQHRYMDAYRAAGKLALDPGAQQSVKDDATYLKQKIDDVIQKRIQMMTTLYPISPHEAVAWANRFQIRFSGHPAMQPLSEAVSRWESSHHTKQFDLQFAELRALQMVIDKAGHSLVNQSAKIIITKLQSLAKKSIFTRVTELSNLEIWRLQQDLNQPGYLGTGIKGKGNEQGFPLGQITAGSPAEKAGLLQGDVVAVFNGISLQKRSEFYRLLKVCKAGTTVEFQLLRDGQEKTIHVVLGRVVH